MKELFKCFIQALTELLKNFWDAITAPIIAVIVLIDESKRINEDGSWDSYHAKRNARAMRKEQRKNG